MFNDYLAREYGISILEVKSYLEIGRRYSLIYTEMYSSTQLYGKYVTNTCEGNVDLENMKLRRLRSSHHQKISHSLQHYIVHPLMGESSCMKMLSRKMV